MSTARNAAATTQCDPTIHPFVVERGSRVTGYVSAATFWIMNHGVAETEQDMEALILGAASMSSEPVSFLLPSRQASFFRWCLAEGLRVIKPMTLMTMANTRSRAGAISLPFCTD